MKNLNGMSRLEIVMLNIDTLPISDDQKLTLKQLYKLNVDELYWLLQVGLAVCTRILNTVSSYPAAAPTQSPAPSFVPQAAAPMPAPMPIQVSSPFIRPQSIRQEMKQRLVQDDKSRLRMFTDLTVKIWHGHDSDLNTCALSEADGTVMRDLSDKGLVTYSFNGGCERPVLTERGYEVLEMALLNGVYYE